MQTFIQKYSTSFSTFRFYVAGTDNQTKQERKALNSLSKNSNVVLKPADKGSKIVMLDKTQYLIEAKRQLSQNILDHWLIHCSRRPRDKLGRL